MGAVDDAADARSLLFPSNFATRFARGDLRNRQVMALQRILSRLNGALGGVEFEEFLEDLAYWLQSRRAVPEQRPGEAAQTARLRMLLEAMEHLPAERAALQASMARLFATSRAVTLFTDVGLPSRPAFAAETFDRLSRALLPDPPVEGDLGQLLPRLFESRRAVEWFEGIAPELAQQLFTLLAVPEGPALEPLRRDLGEAAVLLAVRISHHGLANDVRARAPASALSDSAFFKLSPAVRAAVAGSETTPGAWREAIAACRKLTKDVEAALEHTGVSVDLVFRLDLVRRMLDRLYALLALVAPSGGAAVEGSGLKLLTTLVRGANRDRSVGDVFRSSTRLLARRVVDAAAHSGEHYVTRTPTEYHALLSSAGGGGFLTGFTCLLKYLLSWARLAPFWEGFTFSLNYAGSFFAMHLLHFTLASKQPAMTAALLARSLGEAGTEDERLDSLALEVARTVRSQLAATIGNLGMVVVAAIAIDSAVRLTTGESLLDEVDAAYAVEVLHPFKTLLIPYAALTGAALWLASLAGGAVENWAVYRRLPQALASNRLLRAVLGPERAKRLSAWLMGNIAGFGGSLALGLQMGLVSPVAAFFGLPLKLPHVTLSTGNLVFAGMYRGPYEVFQADFGWAVAGIAVVGSLNFGVSFALALAVALRAREAGALPLWPLARAVGRLFVKRPREFFVPGG
ncbi:MAG: site-specific recombinase [Myxococcaceae bacterium]|nr:site-specific recombinase [Myxococcaceae bacterium]